MSCWEFFIYLFIAFFTIYSRLSDRYNCLCYGWMLVCICTAGRTEAQLLKSISGLQRLTLLLADIEATEAGTFQFTVRRKGTINSHVHFVLSLLSFLRNKGHTIVQDVVAGFPPRKARVRAHVWSYEICGGQNDTGVGFSECFGFLCQSFYRIFLMHHHPSSRADTLGQMVVDVRNGLCITPLQEITSKEEVQGKINHMFSFDAKRTAWKM
jgi:hypothetical protein